MRIAALSLVGAVGLAASALSASAAPIAPPAAPPQANIVQVAGGCGWGFHPNHWGRCAPNRGYYRPHASWRPYWRGYYGGGYVPSDQYWGPPSDHVANQLNRQALGWAYGY
jgi:hypothetical protein